MAKYRVMMYKVNKKSHQVIKRTPYFKDSWWDFRTLEDCLDVCRRKFLEALEVTDNVWGYDMNFEFEGKKAYMAYMRTGNHYWVYSYEEVNED